jgi:tRNA-dihydrouridine synthase B
MEANTRKVNKDTKLFLAPLAGYTDSAFRTITFKMGVDIAYSEMISAKAMCYKDKKTLEMLNISPEEGQVGIQLFGSEDLVLKKATCYLDKREDVSIIDLNLGCPAPKIVKNGEGSALLKEPSKIYSLVKSMKLSTSKPVSAKIRLGIENNLNYLEVSKAIEEAGADLLIVHGRTREQQYSGESNWEAIGEIKSSVSIPVVGNGDIKSGEDAKNAFETFKVDGLMIGRGAVGNPWIFREIKDYLSKGSITKISDTDKFDIILEHIELICNLKGERIGIPEMRKHLHSYLKGMKNSSKLKNELNTIKNKDELIEILLLYKEELLTYSI